MKRSWIVWIVVLVACGNPHFETIVIRGSDTEVNLVLSLAEQFMDNDPEASIGVTGGGSGTGIASLINKKTDIANSSRAFLPSEIELARSRGVDVQPIIFAVDALCFIVHESSPMDSLRLQDVRNIFTGKTDNWSEITGVDLPISLYGRQGNSGTFLYIQRNILQNDYAAHMKQMNGSSQIVEGIKNDPAGIGYVGIGYALNEKGLVSDGIKVLSIRTEGQKQAVSPILPENIIDEKYSVVRPLYQYVDGKPKGKLKEFLEFELSPLGQQIISQNGYFPIPEKYRVMNQKILSDE